MATAWFFPVALAPVPMAIPCLEVDLISPYLTSSLPITIEASSAACVFLPIAIDLRNDAFAFVPKATASTPVAFAFVPKASVSSLVAIARRPMAVLRAPEAKVAPLPSFNSVLASRPKRSLPPIATANWPVACVQLPMAVAPRAFASARPPKAVVH